ncbi:murein transglycosylase A [Nitratireductor kimnyeongensis]|uniref:peptidoglycan lytic exotransglycosylase n=1 Tax=Nitratireductor kimnyeongensis TaxID=430679 RepID=A0ABW0TDG8_9HYPH|nr:murein transglycosylase A [Nitratireductor kimnyeongensis]QZZ37080.1 murein transglycosylase A [Nitratireductor kimnyeongensis]
MSGEAPCAAAPFAALSPGFEPCSFQDVPGWQQDSVLDAFHAFARSAARVESKPYRSGSLGVVLSAFESAHAAARVLPSADERAARAFFEDHFIPCRIRSEDGGPGFVTGYYEPEVEASSVKTDRFHVPLYRRPDDLVDVDDSNRPNDLDPYFAFARETDSGLVAYHDRSAIDRGALGDRGLELVWLDNRVDAYFIHVQGAARLRLQDGTPMRVTYAAKSGHHFTGAGKVLIERGELSPESVTMQSIRAWFSENPDRIDEILWRNRSFIFFRETEIGDEKLGPVAAAKVQLAPGRSIAVDRLLHTFGTPFFIDAPDLRAGNDEPFRRLMIAQDAGSAITGQARADLFIGSGAAAGEIAGGIRHKADFYALVPRALLGG